MKNRFPPIHYSICNHAQLNPLKEAVVCGNTKVSYQELKKKVNALAFNLQQNEIKKGDVIAVLLEPSIEFIISILGAFKAGAAYIPLSTSFPTERIESILKTSGSRLIISDKKNQKLLENTSCKHLIYETLDFKEQEYKVDVDISGEDLAYILFTSGSTGVPKGVEIKHKNLSYYTSWTTSFFKNSLKNKLPLSSDINFAAAVSQIFSCLSAGETLHIVPNLLKDPEHLFKWYSENPEYGLYCVPSVWSLAIEWFKKNKNKQSLQSPKALFLSGEDVSQSLIHQTQKLFPKIPIWNLYGPTEAVANLSFKKVTGENDISIGNPLPGTNFYVIKEDGSEAKVGEQGFLYASGPGISSGYLHNKELTQKTFFKYESQKNGVVDVYNTGDFVSRIEEDEYRFSGRKDQQIKINGQRIELGEIENTLANHPLVSKNVILFLEKSIIAYIKPEEKKPSIQELRNYLLNFLPSAAVPEKWSFIDEFPVLANGKINRKLLPEIEYIRPELDNNYIPPSNKEEEKIICLYEGILNVEKVGMHDSFFDLGGNSLKAISLLIEVEETFSQKISFQHFFENPSPAALLKSFSKEQYLKPIFQDFKTKRSEKMQLSIPQRSLFFFLQANPLNTSYNIAYSIKLNGSLDVDRLEEAIRVIIKKNELLSSKLIIDDGQPYFIQEEKDFSLNLETLEDIVPSEQQSFIDTSISNIASIPFSFDDHLFKFKLYKISSNKYVLGFVISHLIFDGESLPNFITQLTHYYSSNKSNEPSFSSISFSEISFLRNEYEKTENYKESLGFWKRYLKGVKAINGLPKIYEDKTTNSFESETVLANIDPNFRKKLAQISAQKDITLNMLFLSAFASTLYRIGNQEEYLIAMPFSNRLSKAEQNSIGYLSNTLYLRTKCNAEKSFDKLANEIKADTIRILDHQQVPLDELVKILRKEGVNLALSAFKQLFAYHQTDTYSSQTDELQIESKEVTNGNAKCDLQFECFDNSESITLKVTYDKAVIDEAFALQFVRLLKQILQNVLEDFDSKIGEIPKMWTSEKEEVLRKSLGTQINFDSELTLFNLFEAACEKHKDLPAVNYYDKVLTYKQVMDKIALTVEHLKTLNLNKEHPVAIYMDHTPEMIVAMLAMAASGVPYIPIDPTYPKARKEYIIQHAGTNCVLTTSDQSTSFLNDDIRIVFIDETLKEEVQVNNIKSTVDKNDLLYLIYTSGSTGNPKGVMVPNKGVANYLLWMQKTFDVTTESIILGKTSISFDISVWELFLPLISGGTLVLKKRADIESPEQIASTINSKEVTIAQFVPSGLRLFNNAKMFSSVPTLKKVFCGGEKMPIDLKKEVTKEFSGTLHNLYGPTEASIFMSHYQCVENPKYNSVPIGKPILNSSMYILDDEKKLVPRGIPGHIYIGGEILAEGYWKDIEKTEKVFVKPSDDISDKVIYKTGDIGRMMMDGNFEFHGRNDHQIKIRGYRVELGEIEAAILKYSGIREVVAYKHQQDIDDERLNALIIAETFINTDDLKRTLSLLLPKYMIPSFIYQVDTIPKLPNGKINFKALEENKQKKTMNNTQNKNSNENDVEATIYKVWTEVIGHDDFSMTDNFFDAGGHSIRFLKIKDKLEKVLSMDFSIIELYQYPNIKSLAEEYRKRYANLASDKAKAIRSRIQLKKQSYGRSRRK